MESPQPHHAHSSQFYTSSEPVTERISSKRFLGDADRTVGESVTGLKSAMKKELLNSLSINPNLAADIFPDASLPFTINTELIDKLFPVTSTSRTRTRTTTSFKQRTHTQTTTTQPISAPKTRAQRTTNRVKSTSTAQSSSTATHANSMSRPRTRGTPGRASGGDGSLLYHPPSDWSEVNIATWMNNIGAALEGVYRENHSTDPRAYKDIHGVTLTPPKKIWIPHYSTTPLKGSEFRRKPNVILVNKASIKNATWPKVHALSEVTRTEMSQSKTIKDTIHQKSYIIFKAQDNRCFVPSLSFTCDAFTLTVCDRAGVVESQTWKIAEQPLTLLRIIAGLMFARPSDIGYDETIHCKEGKATSILSGGVKYTVEEELFVSDSVKGRATKCWRASTGEGDDYREQVVIKDSWADVRRTRSEIETLTVIQENGLCDGHGIPELVHGEDVLVCGVSGSKRVYVVDSTACYHVRDESRGEERVHRRLVMKPVGRHITNFKSLKELVGAFMDIVKAHAALCNKGILHRDISINNVMLSSPKSTECRAKGLLIDYDYAFCSSLLFPLLTESAQPPTQPSDPSPSDPPAQTHGNETSTKIQDREILLHRTGTLPFMSIQLLLGRNNEAEHKAEHDLESLFYVLLYICTMYEGPGNRNSGDRTEFEHPFGDWIDETTSWKLIAAARTTAFLHPTQTYENVLKHVHVYFAPLLPLLHNLCDTVFTVNHNADETSYQRSPDQPCGTHEAILCALKAIFDMLPDQDAVCAGDEPNATDTPMDDPTNTQTSHHPPSTIFSHIGDGGKRHSIAYGSDSGYGGDDINVTLLASTSSRRRSDHRSITAGEVNLRDRNSGSRSPAPHKRRDHQTDIMPSPKRHRNDKDAH